MVKNNLENCNFCSFVYQKYPKLRLMKRFATLFAFFSIVFFIQAQEGFHIGAKASFSTPFIINQNNFGTLDGFNNQFAKKSELGYKIAVGGNFGMAAGYNFSDHYGFQFELLLDKMGQKYAGDIKQDVGSTNFDVLVKRKVNLLYLNLPLLFKYEAKTRKMGRKKKIKYYLTVGPQVGFLLSVYETVEIDNPDIPNNLANIQEREKFQSIDFGLAINNGVNIYFNRWVYLNAGLDLYFGLVDINGNSIKDLGYFSDNDVEYKPSHNFRPALNVGVHYLLTQRKFY